MFQGVPHKTVTVQIAMKFIIKETPQKYIKSNQIRLLYCERNIGNGN